MANILVVDDEHGIRELLNEILNDEGHAVELAENAAQARAARARSTPDLVLLDIWMPDTDGVSLLKEWSATGLLSMPVIMMSGHATIDTAVEATKIGAFSFLEKPITMQKLLKAVESGLNRGQPKRPPPVTTGVIGASSPPAPAPSFSSYGSPPPQLAQTSTSASFGYNPVAVAPSASQADLNLTVEAAMNGGQRLPTMVDLGPQSTQQFDLDRPLRESRDAFEKAYFEFHLAKEGGSMTRVAERTGLERTHLYRKLKQLGVDLTRGRRGGTL
jgi:DNA-binding NtrC family response regulator